MGEVETTKVPKTGRPDLTIERSVSAVIFVFAFSVEVHWKCGTQDSLLMDVSCLSLRPQGRSGPPPAGGNFSPQIEVGFHIPVRSVF